MNSRIKNLLPLYLDFFSRYRSRVIFLVILGFVVGFLEGVGIGMLIPLFTFIVKGGDFGSDFISRGVRWTFDYFHLAPNLWVMLFAFTFLFLLSAALSFYYGYIDNKIRADYEKKVRSKLYDEVFSSSWVYLMKQKVGHLDYILMTGIPAQTKLITQILSIIRAITGFLTYFLVALSISASITLITGFFGVILFLLLRPIANRMEKYMKHQAFLGTSIAHDINENITGLKTIKASGIEEEVAERGHYLFEQLKMLATKQYLVEKIFTIFWQPAILIFVCIVFAVAYTYDRAHFDLAAFVAVIYLIQRIFMHISKFQGTTFVMRRAYPQMELVANLRRDVREHDENKNGTEPFRFERELAFRDVYFSYNDEAPVLAGVSFKVKRGEMVGIVGRSGMGKTTICDLLLQLFTPNKGGIYIDEKNITDIVLKDWRQNIGYVAQDIFLKNDTVENNIKFFSKSISDEEMIASARTANIYDFIVGLPKGFQTVVGERGLILSGGQKQRIILARVLARRPKILLLDEATSALDNESESLVQDAIERLRGGMTIIAIAHRLSTVMRSDHLLVLDEGRIAEEGKPEMLLQDKDSYFYKMYNIA